MNYYIFGINLLNLKDAFELGNYTLEKENKVYNMLSKIGIPEAIIIQKCNNIEFQIFTDNELDKVKPKILKIWRDNAKGEINQNQIYIKQNKNAIQHFFETAIGLRSILLGDSQVYGQLFNAYKNAIPYFKLEFFRILFSQLRKLKSNNDIKEFLSGYTSIERIIVEYLDKNSLLRKKILVNGAGKMANLLIKTIYEKNPQAKIIIYNKTKFRIKNIIKKYPDLKHTEYICKKNVIFPKANVLINCAPGKKIQSTLPYNLIIDISNPILITKDNIEKGELITLDYFINVKNSIIAKRKKKIITVKNKIAEATSLTEQEIHKFVSLKKIIQNHKKNKNRVHTNEFSKLLELRSEVFKVARAFLYKNGFIEVHTPKITIMETDPVRKGDEKFIVDWFGRKVYLAQSNQIYKQILITSTNSRKIFELAPFYRKEKKSSRHLCEAYSLDIETTEIENHRDLMNIVESLIKVILKEIYENETLKSIIPKKIDFKKKFPIINYTNAIEILKDNKIDIKYGEDIGPKREKQLFEILKIKKITNAFFFIENYRREVKKFYTADWIKPGLTRTFDLILNGWEICSGAEREISREKIEMRMKDFDIDIKKYKEYLDIFNKKTKKHGGFGLGIDRLIAKIINCEDLSEAVLFPRTEEMLIP